MKARSDLVTNSSSSCFVIRKDRLTLEQYELIQDHIRAAKERFPGKFDHDEGDAWTIEKCRGRFQ